MFSWRGRILSRGLHRLDPRHSRSSQLNNQLLQRSTVDPDHCSFMDPDHFDSILQKKILFDSKIQNIKKYWFWPYINSEDFFFFLKSWFSKCGSRMWIRIKILRIHITAWTRQTKTAIKKYFSTICEESVMPTEGLNVMPCDSSISLVLLCWK